MMKNTYRNLTLLALALFLVGPMDSRSFAQSSLRTIEIQAHRYAFEPSEITLKRGDTVQLRLVSNDVPHSLLISDLGINETATKSHPGEATLTAKTVGDFHGRCGRFCGSGHGRMVFTVHVIGG